MAQYTLQFVAIVTQNDGLFVSLCFPLIFFPLNLSVTLHVIARLTAAKTISRSRTVNRFADTYEAVRMGWFFVLVFFFFFFTGFG
jgi:hypothetical protein